VTPRVGRILALGLLPVMTAGVAPAAGQSPASTPAAAPTALVEEVRETERAFAKSMADRDHAAFTAFLAEEAVFLSEQRTLRGKAEVGAAWKRYFEGPAPFSWEPERVEVLDSGTLALSTGPVRDPAGSVVATFTSVWRREADGRWRIIFDKGCPACARP
jgi:ketosteroid isomerase-like protein